MRRALAMTVCIGVVIGGCNTNPEDNTVKSIVASPTAHAPRTFLVPGHSALGVSRLPNGEPAPSASAEADSQGGALQWTKPSSWEQVPSESTMRIATYRVHHAQGDTEDGEMSVTRVGGDIESNISRWVGQFEEKPTPTRKSFSIDTGTPRPLKLTVVKLIGTYTGGGMPGGPPAAPKPDTALLAVIVEAGGDPYFFKLTGPKATVDAAKDDFGALTQSFRLGK